MEVTNRTTFKLCACCWHTKYGYGEKEVLLPNETKEIKGPFIGEMGGGDCYIDLPGKINCQETPDEGNCFQVTPDTPLNLQSGEKGITVEFTTADIVI